MYGKLNYNLIAPLT